MNINEIIAQYSDDRDSLTEEEFVLLARAMETDPDIARKVKDQFVLDELLSREIGRERQVFLDQVKERLRAENEADTFARKTVKKAQEVSKKTTASTRRRVYDQTTVKRKRSLLSTRRHGPGLWRLGASVAACVLIIAGVYYLNIQQAVRTPDLVRAKLIEVTQGITILRQGQTIPGKPDMDIQVDDMLVTQGEGRATIKYKGEATFIELKDKTILSIHEEKGAKKLELMSGSVTCDVDTQPAGSPMVIKTPHAQAEVLGSLFTIFAEEVLTRLEVTHGRIRLIRALDKKEVIVASGEFAQAGQGIELVVRKIRDKDGAKEKPGVAEPQKIEPVGTGTVTAAVIQVKLTGRLSSGADVVRIEKLIRQAADNGARLVLLPGLTFSNAFKPVERVIASAQPIDGELTTRMRSLASDLNIYIAFGLREKISHNETGNTAILIDNKGEVVLVQRKIAVAIAERSFTKPGKKINIADTPFGTVVMLISKDVHSGGAFAKAKAMDFDLMLVLNCDDKVDGGIYSRRLSRMTQEKKCTALMANHVFSTRGGRSGAFFSNRTRKEIKPIRGEGILLVEIPLKK